MGLPRSRWANPCKVTTGVSRSNAIRAFRRHLLASPDLLLELHTLAGQTLACHCTDGQACYGDVIIELFGQLTPAYDCLDFPVQRNPPRLQV